MSDFTYIHRCPTCGRRYAPDDGPHCEPRESKCFICGSTDALFACEVCGDLFCGHHLLDDGLCPYCEEEYTQRTMA